MSEREKNAWTGTAILAAAIGAVVLSANVRVADASTPPRAQADQAVAPLDQADDDPPFGTFLGACETDSDCSDGNTCNAYRKRGSHCSHGCETAADCSGGPVARCTKQNRCGLNEPVKTR